MYLTSTHACRHLWLAARHPHRYALRLALPCLLPACVAHLHEPMGRQKTSESEEGTPGGGVRLSHHLEIQRAIPRHAARLSRSAGCCLKAQTRGIGMRVSFCVSLEIDRSALHGIAGEEGGRKGGVEGNAGRLFRAVVVSAPARSEDSG